MTSEARMIGYELFKTGTLVTRNQRHADTAGTETFDGAYLQGLERSVRSAS
jgi:hypothetical protein